MKNIQMSHQKSAIFLQIFLSVEKHMLKNNTIKKLESGVNLFNINKKSGNKFFLIFQTLLIKNKLYPANIYLLKLNNKKKIRK